MTLHLVLPVVLPLAGAILCLLFYHMPRVQRMVALSACVGLVLYLAGVLWPVLSRAGYATLRVGNWPAPYGIVLAVDLLSAIMLSLAAVVGLIVLVYAGVWFRGASEEPLLYPLYLVLLMGLNGAFLTGDIFNLYVFFEVMLVSSFGLMVLGGARRQIEGTVKYLAISQVSSVLFLIGAGLLYGLAGTLNMADLARKLAVPGAAPYTAIVALLFLGAFGIKAAVFPLFFWLPASYHVAKTPVGAIFAGLLAEVGVYGLCRAYTLLFPAQWPAQSGLLLAIAAITMLVGVLGAIAQNDIKRVLSFDIISQIGYLVMALGIRSPLAVAAGVYFMIHIALVKTSLFLLAGVAEQATGSTDLREMGGLLRREPVVALLFMVMALALAGVPPLSGFYAKLGLVLAAVEAGEYAVAGAALATSLLTLYVVTRVWTLAFMRARPEERPAQLRADGALLAPAAGLSALAVTAALLAAPALALAQRAAAQLVDTAPYIAAVLGG